MRGRRSRRRRSGSRSREQTYHRWRNQYGGMKADDAKRLRELERENAAAEADRRRQGTRYRRAQGDREGKLVSPSLRREAVCMLQARLELSERRACRVTGQHRSTQRRLPAHGRGDDALRTELHAFSRGHPRWGYRRAWATLRKEGRTVNRKRVQRLWREEGLRVPAKRRKRQRPGHSAVPAARLRAERPNHVWALDFQFDPDRGRAGPEAAQHRRRAHAGGAGGGGRQAHQRRRHRRHARGDRRRARDGAGVHPLRQRARAHGQRAARLVPVPACTGSSYIEPGAPWENPYVESFNGRLRDEFLAVEQFDSLLEAQVLIEDWRIEYNTKRPHSSLGWLAPATYAERWEAQLHAGLS